MDQGGCRYIMLLMAKHDALPSGRRPVMALSSATPIARLVHVEIVVGRPFRGGLQQAPTAHRHLQPIDIYSPTSAAHRHVQPIGWFGAREAKLSTGDLSRVPAPAPSAARARGWGCGGVGWGGIREAIPSIGPPTPWCRTESAARRANLASKRAGSRRPASDQRRNTRRAQPRAALGMGPRFQNLSSWP